MRVFVIVTGPTGAGKSELVKMLVKAFRRTIVTGPSRLIREEMMAAGLEITADSVRQYGTTKMEAGGPGYWTRRIIERYQDVENAIIVIDGLRSAGGIHILRGAGEQVCVIGVEAPIRLRYQRVRRRRRQDEQAMSSEALWRWLQQELVPGEEWGYQIAECLALADYRIDGSQPLPQVRLALEPAIRHIRRLRRRKRRTIRTQLS